jgi:hypothetical protein
VESWVSYLFFAQIGNDLGNPFCSSRSPPRPLPALAAPPRPRAAPCGSGGFLFARSRDDRRAARGSSGSTRKRSQHGSPPSIPPLSCSMPPRPPRADRGGYLFASARFTRAPSRMARFRFKVPPPLYFAGFVRSQPRTHIVEEIKTSRWEWSALRWMGWGAGGGVGVGWLGWVVRERTRAGHRATVPSERAPKERRAV